MLVLRQLLDQAGISANALAKKIHLPTPTVNRLLTGEVEDPRASTLIEIANYFGITLDQLVGRASLEGKLVTEGKAGTLKIKPPLSIPLLSLAEATQFENYVQTPRNWIRWQPLYPSTEISGEDKLFAVTIKNNLYEPIFFQGTRVIVNPVITPESGDYVVVSFINDSTAAIKKYISEGPSKYLYPLQKELKTINFDPENSRMIGVVIASHLSFKE
jgi:SOS-response transcriptional repressor LexA